MTKPVRRSTDTALVPLEAGHGPSAESPEAIEAEIVRSGKDRRRRQDRRTEDKVRRRLEHGLEELVWDGTPVPQPARIIAAERLFSEGSAYFTGTLVDRSS